MRARAVLGVLGGVAYIAVSHWLMTQAPASDWNAVVVVGPMLALAAFVAWQRRARVTAVVASLATAALLWGAWRGGGLAPNSLYVAQHVAVHALLAFMFGTTLQAGREPLVTALARRVHDGISADMAVYARKVTLAWTVYFLAMASFSLLLYATAPFPVWAVFANIATPLAVVAMFVGEFVLRYRLHPEFERATLAQALSAYSQRSAPAKAGAPHRD